MKSQKISALVLSIMLGATSLAGCKKENTDSNPEETAKNVLTTHVVNDFSNITDLYQIILKNDFGSAELNSDENYSRSGSSAKLTIRNAANSDLPTLRQRLSSEILDYDYTDFTKAKRLKLSIYNPSEEKISCYLCLEFTKGKTARTTYTLENGWNELVYEVDRSALIASFPLDETAYLACMFERKTEPYTLYLDDISITQTAADIENIEYTISQNEICLFDKNYQGTIISFANDVASKISMIVDYGLTADPDRTINGSAFYVSISKGEKERGTWTYMSFQEEYKKLIDWKQITAEDTIEWDVFCEGAAYNLTWRFYSKAGALSKYETPVYGENGEPVMVDSEDNEGNPITVQKTELKDVYSTSELKANSWTHFKLRVSQLEASARYYGWLDPDDETCDEIGEVIDRMWFAWGEFTDVDERTLYFDEMKIVKGGANR